MNILFNALIATEKPFGYSTVITSYLDALCDYLDEHPGFLATIYVTVQRRALEQIDPHKKLRRSPHFRMLVLPNMTNVLFRAGVEQMYLNYAALRHACQVIHMPATLGLIFALRKQLLFFHASTTFLLERKTHGRSVLSTFLHNLIIKLSSSRADILATTTHTTAQELLGYLKKDRPFVVIGNGFKSFETTMPPDPSLVQKLEGKRFVLFVSSFYELKNQSALIEAFKAGNLDGLHLVLVGNPVQDDYYQRCLADLNPANTTIAQADSATLAWLYRSCVTYVSPSRFEGFSLTPLEALSMGASILLSDLPVHREVYGSDFLYFDPSDIHDLRAKIRQATNPAYSESSLPAAKRVLEKFTWRRFTERNVELYQQMLHPGIKDPHAPSHP